MLMAQHPVGGTIGRDIIARYVPDASFVSFGPDRFCPAERDHKSALVNDLSDYRDGLRRLRRTCETKWPEMRPETVLYMMSGTDAALPLILFPDARCIIHLDNHPFLSYAHMAGARDMVGFGRGPIGTFFRYSFDVDGEGYLARRLLPTLIAGGDAVRVLGVTAFARPATDERSAYIKACEPRYDFPAPPVRDPVHGWIEFDHGEGTPARQLIHLQVAIPGADADPSDTQMHLAGVEQERWDLEKSWWVRFIGDMSPGALVVKAAASMALPGRLHPGFRAVVDAWLASVQGYLFEGMEQGFSGIRSNSYEYTGYTGMSRGPDILHVRHIPYGYHDRARVERYGPAGRAIDSWPVVITPR